MKQMKVVASTIFYRNVASRKK